MSFSTRQRRRRHQRGGRFAIAVLVGAIVAVLAAGGVGAAVVLHYAGEAPPLSALRPLVPGGNSEVFAANGTPLGYISSDVLRTPVHYKDVPADLRNATVAIEDQRFWQHGGVDVQGIIRSAIKDVLSGQPLQGASTIAMQLVRNAYLPASERTERTLKRKIIEAVEADRLAKGHSKPYILVHYLNSVPYGTVGGQNAIGVGAAARIFFNLPVSRLNLAQCALLAGLPQAPSEYNPFLNPSAARTRRDEVLNKMAQLGYVSRAQADAAIASPLQVRHSTYYSHQRDSYFFDYVTQQLIARYGQRTVEQGGLHVYTTIDLRMQDLARKAIAQDLGQPGDPSAAIVTEDPHNGYILAMTQSQSSLQYNLVTQGHRQPGSTFKAIDLAQALSQGVNPDSTYFESHTLDPGWLPGYPTYQVKTYEGTSLNRPLSLTQATLASDNTVYAQLAADLGEQNITQMAYRMGVVTHLSSFPAEALGGLTVGVSPLEMANVYSTLADGGWRNEPISITRVTFPDGHSDSSWGTPHRVKVLSDGITAEETKVLGENVQSGTAVRSAISCPTAAKTGTTSDFIDAWLDGYTPNYATVVWMGYPTKRVSMTDVHGETQQGGALPAQIWHDYMTGVVDSAHCAQFPAPTQPLVYQPFYGKYQSSAAYSPPSSSKPSSTHHHTQPHGPSVGGNGNSSPNGNGNSNGTPSPPAQPPSGHGAPIPGQAGGTGAPPAGPGH